jgi:hypothetical protein
MTVCFLVLGLLYWVYYLARRDRGSRCLLSQFLNLFSIPAGFWYKALVNFLIWPLINDIPVCSCRLQLVLPSVILLVSWGLYISGTRRDARCAEQHCCWQCERQTFRAQFRAGLRFLKLKSKLYYDRQSDGLCLGVRRSSGTCDQFFFLHEISFRQLRLCYFVAPSLTRGRVCLLSVSVYS